MNTKGQSMSMGLIAIVASLILFQLLFAFFLGFFDFTAGKYSGVVETENMSVSETKVLGQTVTPSFSFGNIVKNLHIPIIDIIIGFMWILIIFGLGMIFLHGN